MNKYFLVLLFSIGCKGTSKQTNSPLVDGQNSSQIKNYVNYEQKVLETGITLGSGANHFFPFDKQPRTFSTCLDTTLKNDTPSSRLSSKLYIKISDGESEEYEKRDARIKQTLSASAKYKLASMDIKTMANTFNSIAQESKNKESAVEVIFEANRVFSRVSLDNVYLKPEMISSADNNTLEFYKKCGTGAAVSVVKDVYFSAKASCKKSDNFSKFNSLKELESSLELKMANKNLLEVEGGINIASNLGEIIKTLSKNGINECWWNIESTGIPTLSVGPGLIDIENLVSTAQKGLDLVMQATYSEADIKSIEILPYMQLSTPKEYRDFFNVFNGSIIKKQKDIKNLEQMANEQIDKIVILAMGGQLAYEDAYSNSILQSIKISLDAINFLKLNPVPNAPNH